MEKSELRLITSSPQIHSFMSTAKIMWIVSLTLLPAAVWGVYVFGIESLVVLAVSIASALLAELAVSAVMKEFTLWDGSAFLTGLLIGFNMPPTLPLYIPVIASLFAIWVVKWSFGGLGRNWMNPALAGRVFVFFSFSSSMSTYKAPATWVADTVSSATPLSAVKSGLMEFTGAVQNSSGFLQNMSYPQTATELNVISWFSNTLNINIPAGYVDAFVGNIPGCIGEVSALLLLLGGLILIALRIVRWHIPVMYFASFGILTWVFGGLRFGNGFFAGDALFHFITGGFMLGALYMATDMVTSPLSKKGMMIYGIGVGFLTFLIRFYGSFPEGVSLAILLMNIFVPFIDRYTGPKRFGMKEVTE